MNRKWRSTKDKVLYILKKQSEVSMKELMESFVISEAAVRKQLNELLRLGFVCERTVKKDIGRPYHLYFLTDKGHQTFPNQYESLPVELLQDLEVSQGESVVYHLLETRKKREEQEIKIEVGEGAFEDRIQDIVAYQEKKGYMVDMNETADGDFEVINYNCPIYHLAASYDVVCTHEKEIYKDIFPGSSVISNECMTSGGYRCCWTITNPVNEK